MTIACLCIYHHDMLIAALPLPAAAAVVRAAVDSAMEAHDNQGVILCHRQIRVVDPREVGAAGAG